jgi:uncharacterized membrane protein
VAKRSFSMLAAGLVALMGCGDDTGETTPVDCSTVKPFSELTQPFSKCTTCHTSSLTDLTTRQSAPLEYNYDTYAEAIKFPEKMVATLRADAEFPMPPSTDPQLTEAEKTDLITWAECDTPE